MKPSTPSESAIGLRPTLQRIDWFGPVVVGIMVGCVAWSVVGLFLRILPELNGAYLTLASVLVALEAGYSFRLLRSRIRFGDQVTRFRAVELIMLIILLKAGSFWGDSWAIIWADILTWPHNPSAILDLDTGLALIFGLFSWLTATASARDFRALGEPPVPLRHEASPTENLAQRFFYGGIVLLAMVGLSLIGSVVSEADVFILPALFRGLRDSRSPVMALDALLYFTLGLVMLGQVHLVRLQKRWLMQGIPVDQRLVGRWRRASLVLVGAAALVAFLFPTAYSFGVLGAIRSALMWVMGAVTYLAGLVLFLIASLLSPLFSFLFRGEPGDQAPLTPPEFDFIDTPAQTPGVTPDWMLWMRTAFFWALALGGIWYVTRTYLRDHPELWASLREFRPLRALLGFWAALRSLFGRWKRIVRKRIPRLSLSRSRERRQEREPFRFFRIGALAARERILYYYLSTLKRAERAGYPRRSSETPYEYDHALEPHLTRAREEMSDLTEAFIKARYSQHPIGAGREKRVRVLWEEVRRELRRLRPSRSVDG